MVKYLVENKKTLFPDKSIAFYMLSMIFLVVSMFLSIKANSIAIGLFGIAWLVNSPFINFIDKIKNNKLAWAFISLYMLHGIGLLYSTNMQYGGKEMEYKLSLLLIPIFVATGPKINLTQQKLILKVFYHSVLALVLVGLLVALQSYFSQEAVTSIGGEINRGKNSPKQLMHFLTYRSFSTPVGFDPIYFALYIVFAIFALVKDKILDRNLDLQKESRIAPALIFTILFIALIFLSSRMEILVFVACSYALSLCYGIIKKKWKIAIAVMLLIPILSYSLISINSVNKERFTEMVDLEADYTENKWGGRSIRIEKWKNAIECWAQFPIFGAGTGDTIDELVKVYEKNEFELAIQHRFNPHNQYLQTAIALGVIGLLSLLIILFLMLHYGIQQRDWLIIMLTLIIGMSVLTESMLERQKGLIFIVFFSMLLFNTYHTTDFNRKTEND